MPRKKRIQFKGAWYHAMNRGINHMNIYYSDTQRNHFISLLEEITDKYDIQIHAFCLMSNHYHLAIHTPLGNLSDAMRHLNTQHTKYVNKELKRTGPLFKGRYHANLLSEGKYLLRVIRYIHQNPLRAKMVENLIEYPWSSYMCYEGSIHYDWLYQDEARRRFSKLKYNGSISDFMMNQSADEISKIFKSLNFNSIVADKTTHIKDLGEFLRESRLPRSYLNKNDILKLNSPHAIELILDLVTFYFNVSMSELCSKNCIKKYNLPRRVAMYMLQKYGKTTQTVIAKVMGDVSLSGVSSALARSKKDVNVIAHADKISKIILVCRSITC